MENVNVVLIAVGIFILAVAKEYVKRKEINGVKSFFFGFSVTIILFLSIGVSNYLTHRPVLDFRSDWLVLVGIFLVVPIIISIGFYKIGVQNEFKDK